MILVIGAQGAGKREYVRALGYADGQIADGLLDARPVLYGLERLVFDAPARAAELLEPLCGKEVVVCREVGSGVIPLARGERDAREETGRLCVRLAQRAERVVRLVCGIPTVIK